MKIYLKIIVVIAALMLLDSCVSKSKYEAMVSSKDSLALVSDSLRDIVGNNNEDIASLNRQLSDARRQITRLQAELINAQDNYEKLKSRATGETKDLLGRIEDLQTEVLRLEAQLTQKQNLIDDINTKLNERDAKMDSLRNSIQEALVGFEGKGFSVDIKDGRVYVSMSNQLLFSSGSTKIDAKGKEALKELANVLNENLDIDILVEGHTDIKPIKSSSYMDDNWDLSVLRATEVVRFLEKDGEVDPTRMIASGRSKYFPVAEGEDPESLAKNRRTEIILTPDLGEIFDAIKG